MTVHIILARSRYIRAAAVVCYTDLSIYFQLCRMGET